MKKLTQEQASKKVSEAIRYNRHLLIIGEEGVGKTHFLKEVCKKTNVRKDRRILGKGKGKK